MVKTIKDCQKFVDVYNKAFDEGKSDSSIVALFQQFKQLINAGEIRAAEKQDGNWQVNQWVKKGILLGFRLGSLIEYSINDDFRFFDKSTSIAHKRKIRKIIKIIRAEPLHRFAV